MLDQRGNETRGADFLQNDKDCFVSDPSPPAYVPPLQRRSTVRELLLMRRQKRSSSDVNNAPEHKHKLPRTDTLMDHRNLLTCGTPAHANAIINNFFPTDPEIGPYLQQQMQPPPLHGQAAPSADVGVSLFHWQIHQEVQRVGGLPPELLTWQDSDGDTFLHIAVAKGRRALAYVLAAKMASCGSLDMKEHNRQTALQIAAATNQPLIIQDLLGLGADVSSRDKWGRSPLHVCAEKGHFLGLQSIQTAVMLTGRPVDIEMYNYEGLTPLHSAVLSHNAAVKEQGSLGNSCSFMVKELQQRRRCYIQCIKTLLLMGATLGITDLKSGRTCLHMAAEEANVELLHLFFQEPSTLTLVNTKTFSGNTALHVASSLQNHSTQVEAVKLLMRKGADPGIRNLENDLPAQLVPAGPIGEKVRRILKGKHNHV